MGLTVVNLRSSDGKLHPVDVEVAMCSETIKTLLENDIGEDDDIIPVSNVTSPVLEKVIEWAVHNKDHPVPEEDANAPRTDNINAWESNFLKVDQGTLFELILAANYLDIKGLLDLSCRAVANLIKGRTPEEIRKIFNIVNDFSPEEEEQVRKENEWCDEK